MCPTCVGACTSSSSASVAAGACTRSHPGQPACSSAASIASIRSGLSGCSERNTRGSCSREDPCWKYSTSLALSPLLTPLSPHLHPTTRAAQPPPPQPASPLRSTTAAHAPRHPHPGEHGLPRLERAARSDLPGQACAPVSGSRLAGGRLRITAVAIAHLTRHPTVTDGLHGPDIPDGALVLAVADAYDAMTRNTAHHAARAPADAVAEFRRCARTQFDPAAVDALANWIASIDADRPSGRDGPR